MTTARGPWLLPAEPGTCPAHRRAEQGLVTRAPSKTQTDRQTDGEVRAGQAGRLPPGVITHMSRRGRAAAPAASSLPPAALEDLGQKRRPSYSRGTEAAWSTQPGPAVPTRPRLLKKVERVPPHSPAASSARALRCRLQVPQRQGGVAESGELFPGCPPAASLLQREGKATGPGQL